MFCKNCGHEISDDAKFCSNCGTKVEVEEEIIEPIEVVDKTQAKEWYYVENNDSKGPFSESDMKGFMDSGVLTGNSFVWKTGMQDWQRLKNTELAGNETVHVEPSFSFTTGVVKEKSIGLCVVLSLVTCGIYGIYWLYTIAHDLNDLCESQNQEKGAEPGLVVVLSIVTCGIYLLYYLWKAGKMVSSLTRSNGHHPSDDSIVLMVLSILQLSLVSYCILQSHINGFAKD